jgi:chromosome segregation ATPase
MNTDTLREKFLRSEEALNRLGEDTKKLVFSRVQELLESKDYLETLIKEKEAVDSQITEQEAKIASYQEEINNQSNLKAEMANKRSSSSEELQAKKVRLEALQNEINEVNNSLNSIKSEIESLKSELVQKREKQASLTKSNQELELKFKTESESKEAEKKELEMEINKSKAENAVISFLLEESAEEIYEVDILAGIMKLGRTTKEQLKDTLAGRVSPVILTRTLGRLAEKNMINYNESNDTISM